MGIDFLKFLDKEVAISKKRLYDQAETLEDMAKILENSKLETDGLREMQASFKEARWTDDKEVNECIQCTKAFNVSRRKVVINCNLFFRLIFHLSIIVVVVVECSVTIVLTIECVLRVHRNQCASVTPVTMPC